MRRNYSQWLGFLVFVAFILVFNHQISAQEEWINYTNASLVYTLAFDGNYLWEGTSGGVIKRSLTDPEGDVTYYTRADGLAGNRVYAVAVDPRGVIWFGTDNGVSKFDGVNWVNYNTLNSGLIDNRVRAIAIDSLGGVWFGTPSGLSRFLYDFGNWDSLLDGVGISVIKVDHAGNVWIGTRSWDGEGQLARGIYKFSPPFYPYSENGVNYNKSNSGLLNNSIGGIAFDSQGNVWIANDWGTPPMQYEYENGILKFDGQSWEVFTYQNSGLSSRWIESLTIDSQDNVWVATADRGIFKYDGTTWVNYDTTNSDMLTNRITAIYADKGDRIWFTYYPVYSFEAGGVGCFDGAAWYHYESSNSGLPTNWVKALAFDPSGNAWLGVSRSHSGISDPVIIRFDGTNWLTYDERDTGIQFGWIDDMAFDKEGNLWIAGDRVYKFDSFEWTTYDTSNSPIPSGGVDAVAVDIDGTKWFVSTIYGMVISFDDSVWTVYTTENSGLPFENLTTIAVDSKGNKWIGSDGGVCRFDGTEWVTYNTSNSGLISNGVRFIQIDSHDNIWIGTNKGLSEFDGTQWTNYDVCNSGMPFNLVTALYIDSNDRVWVATSSSDPFQNRSFRGVSVFDGTDWQTYDIWNSGIASNWVTKIAEDGKGNIWFVHWFRGISVLKKSTTEVEQRLRVADLPREFQLLQNYPNPFNSSTTIPYQIPSRISGSPIKLRIFNMRGQLVRTLVNGKREPGSYSMVWDGRDDRGKAVASGVYFCRLEAGGVREVRKMILLY